MRVLLDTQILLAIGLHSIDVLPARVRRLISDSDSSLFVSAVSITEIAIKASVNRIVMAGDSVLRLLGDLKAEQLPFKPTHAIQLFDLPLHHTDPFDRMLIATAIFEKIPIVAGDEHFPAYRQQGLVVIWK